MEMESWKDSMIQGKWRSLPIYLSSAEHLVHVQHNHKDFKTHWKEGGTVSQSYQKLCSKRLRRFDVIIRVRLVSSKTRLITILQLLYSSAISVLMLQWD